MKRKERLIYFFQTLILISLVIYFAFYKTSEELDIYRQRIDNLNTKIDSLHSENNLLDVANDSLTIQVKEFTNLIEQQTLAISNLKKETNEKVNAVSSFTNSELSRFFAERYGYNLNSSTQ